MNANIRSIDAGPRASLRRAETGFTLLEVLIAVLVLSVGVLGLAGLQAVGINEGQTSYQRGQAVLLAYDISDRMRANRAGAAAGNYAATPPTTAPSTSCLSATTACTPADIAAYDLYNWSQRVKNGLLNGTTQISCVGACAYGNRQTITVTWAEKCLNQTDTGCTTATVPTSFTVNVTP